MGDFSNNHIKCKSLKRAGGDDHQFLTQLLANYNKYVIIIMVW